MINTTEPIYFHYTSESGEDSYFKVNYAESVCTKVCLKSSKKYGGTKNMVGIYHLKWATFQNNYLYWLSKKMGTYRDLKITTGLQFQQAFDKILIQLKQTA